MQAIVITVGDEILRGHTLDTNFHYLARQLAAFGIDLTRHASVADEDGAIRAELRSALDTGGLIILTGGLGGTPDDITLDAVAAELGRDTVEATELLARLESWYRKTNRPMPDPVRRIARQIEGSELLANTAGQAPGVWVEVDGSQIVLMPGVPAEMRAIVEGPLAPKLGAMVGSRRVRVFRVIGIGEATLAQSLAEAGLSGVSFLPSDGRVDVCVLTEDGDGRDFDAMEAIIRDVAGDALIGDGATNLDELVFEMLRERGETLAVAESLTGGSLATAIVSSPGASEVLVGAIVAYADSMKISQLGVWADTLAEHGAVSAETACEMAGGIRKVAASDWGLSTTGIAGPGGATPDKPVGLVYVGVAYPEGHELAGHSRAIRRRIPGNRDQVMRRTVVLALETLRRAMLGFPLPEDRV